MSGRAMFLSILHAFFQSLQGSPLSLYQFSLVADTDAVKVENSATSRRSAAISLSPQEDELGSSAEFDSPIHNPSLVRHSSVACSSSSLYLPAHACSFERTLGAQGVEFRYSPDSFRTSSI
eukprot:6203248-Pleurochrysis_carterae.AAC.1